MATVGVDVGDRFRLPSGVTIEVLAILTRIEHKCDCGYVMDNGQVGPPGAGQHRRIVLRMDFLKKWGSKIDL